jgi:hypothetical protein
MRKWFIAFGALVVLSTFCLALTNNSRREFDFLDTGALSRDGEPFTSELGGDPKTRSHYVFGESMDSVVKRALPELKQHGFVPDCLEEDCHTYSRGNTLQVAVSVRIPIAEEFVEVSKAGANKTDVYVVLNSNSPEATGRRPGLVDRFCRWLGL